MGPPPLLQPRFAFPPSQAHPYHGPNPVRPPPPHRPSQAEEERQRQAAAAWTAHTSPAGVVYYYNSLTEESSYSRPPGFSEGVPTPATAVPVPASAESVPGTEWQEVTCTDGRRYYYHTTTSETSWKVPPEVMAARNRPPPLDPGKAAMLARAVAMGAEAAPEYQGALRTIRLGRGPLAHASGAVMPQAGAADAGPLLALPAPEAAAAGQDVEDEDVFFTEEDIGGATEAAEEAGLGSGGAEEPEGPVETDQGLTEAIPEEGAPAGTAASTTPGSTEVSHTPAGPIVSAAAADATASEAPGGLTQPDLPAGMAPPKAPAGMAPPQAPAGMAPAKAPPGMAPPRLPTGMDAPELPTAMAPTRVPPGMAPPTLPAGLAPPVRPAGHPAQAALVAGDGSRPLDGATPPGAEILRQGLEMPGAAGKETARVALEAFEGLLRALGIHAFSRWEKEVPRMQADPRYKALPPTERRAAFEAYCAKQGSAKKPAQSGGRRGPPGLKPAGADAGEQLGEELPAADAEKAFMDLLRERQATGSMEWSELQPELQGDPRAASVAPERQEALFGEHQSALRGAEAAQHAERAALEAKHAEAERRLEAERRAADARRLTAQRAAAATAFSTLLVESVRHADASWREAWPALRRDAQGRARDAALSRDEAEALFRRHVAELQDAAVDGYVDLLDELLLPLIPKDPEGSLPREATSWREAEVLLGDDPRFASLPGAQREGRWRRFVEDADWSRRHPDQPPRRHRRRQRGAPKREADAPSALDKAYTREYLEPAAKVARN
ncbi:hypothetical protein ACKKBF_B08985 [Auxenochlorella protothecoides x Auxenochlorella symbiontica]